MWKLINPPAPERQGQGADFRAFSWSALRLQKVWQTYDLRMAVPAAVQTLTLPARADARGTGGDGSRIVCRRLEGFCLNQWRKPWSHAPQDISAKVKAMKREGQDA
ncbi:hypothetical protein MASR1M32_37320 [Rhodobacter sp.]